MEKEIYETYKRYGIFIPRWDSDESKVVYVSKYKWLFCRLCFWKYKMNYYHGFLVKINNWTRNRHFEKDYTRKPSMDDVFSQLKKIAHV